MTDARLTRVEEKIDNLTEVVGRLAAHEERMTNLSSRQERLEREQTKLRDEVFGPRGLSAQVMRNTVITGLGLTIGTIIIGGAIKVALFS